MATQPEKTKPVRDDDPQKLKRMAHGYLDATNKAAPKRRDEDDARPANTEVADVAEAAATA
jgi:hypothetical protein